MRFIKLLINIYISKSLMAYHQLLFAPIPCMPLPCHLRPRFYVFSWPGVTSSPFRAGTCANNCLIQLPSFNPLISSHVARHTYATRCLNRGIRLEVVAKLLGHSTTRITQHYAKLLKDNIINEVKDAFEKSY